MPANILLIFKESSSRSRNRSRANTLGHSVNMYKIYICGMYKYIQDFYTLSGIKYLRGDRSFRFSNFTFLANSSLPNFADQHPSAKIAARRKRSDGNIRTTKTKTRIVKNNGDETKGNERKRKEEEKRGVFFLWNSSWIATRSLESRGVERILAV